MIDCEAFFTEDCLAWDMREVARHDINCTVGNGAAGHNHQTKDDNFNEACAMLAARHNELTGESITVADLNFITLDADHWRQSELRRAEDAYADMEAQMTQSAPPALPVMPLQTVWPPDAGKM